MLPFRGGINNIDYQSQILNTGDPGADYANLLIDTYGANVVYRFTDIFTPETTILASDPTLNGTAVNLTLQNVASPVAGETFKAPSWNGSTSYGNLLSPAFNSAFNGGIGSIFFCCRVADASVWTDGTFRRAFLIQVNASNRLTAYRGVPNNAFVFQYQAGGGASLATSKSGLSTTDWFTGAITYKDSANGDEVKFYYGGAQAGPTFSGTGAWAGALAIAAIGAGSLAPVNVWFGAEAYYAFVWGSVWSGPQIAAMHAALAGA